MDNFYFVPHVGFRQQPAAFPDWDKSDKNGLAEQCAQEESCAGFDTDMRARDTSSTRSQLVYYPNADSGSYVKDESGATSLCKQIGGSVSGRDCNVPDASTVQAYVKSQNDTMDALWGPMAQEEFIGAANSGMAVGLAVGALLLLLHVKFGFLKKTITKLLKL